MKHTRTPKLGATNFYHRDITEAAIQIELDGQYRALREEAGHLARDRAVIVVRGPDAAEYLQGQLTNDIERLAPAQGCYAALLDRKGHLDADMRVLRLASGELWLDLEPAPAAGVLKHLRMYSIGRDVEVAEETERRSVVSVIGPRAAELTGFEDLADEHTQRLRDWEGVEVLGVATDTGVDLIVGSDQTHRLRDLLESAGVPAVSDEAAEIIRIELGRPRFGRDMGPEHMPAEAGIVERAVDFEKGCYIGQEPVARLHYRGKPNRTLRGLRLSSPVSAGAQVSAGDRELGRIGSACISPALGPLALAVLRREAEVGDTVTVGDRAVTGEVVELPFLPEVPPA